MEDFFELGRVLKPHGVRGEIKAELYSDDICRVYDIEEIFFKKNGSMEPVRLLKKRADASFVYLFLDGVSDRNAAEGLRDKIFYIDRAHAAPLPEGSYYISDLIGLIVKNEDGAALGSISDILQYGSADIYCVDGDNPFMFPSVPGIFLERSPEKGFVSVNSVRLQEVKIDGI